MFSRSSSKIFKEKASMGDNGIKMLEKLQNKEELDKWTTCVFGECGQGKSTALSAIAKIFAEEFVGANKNVACEFKSGKNF